MWHFFVIFETRVSFSVGKTLALFYADSTNSVLLYSNPAYFFRETGNSGESSFHWETPWISRWAKKGQQVSIDCKNGSQMPLSASKTPFNTSGPYKFTFLNAGKRMTGFDIPQLSIKACPGPAHSGNAGGLTRDRLHVAELGTGVVFKKH